MKNYNRPGTWKRHVLPALLLAAVCIGAVELAVCAHQAPDVYAAITAPIRTAVNQAGKVGELAWNRLRQRTDEAVANGISQIQASLQRLDEHLSQKPEPEPELVEEIQLIDDAPVAPPPNARADYSITSLTIQNGVQHLTGSNPELVYYNQTDDAWAGEPYGSDTIGRYGCGPVAMAMVVSSLSDTPMDPAQMAQHCVDQGYWAKKRGSYWSVVPGTAEDFGLTCTSLPPEETDHDTILHYLSTGQPLVAMVGPGHFTTSGHFIILRGSTLDGSILIADPASLERSLTTWDLDLILEELSPNRSSGGPLWVISPNFSP